MSFRQNSFVRCNVEKKNYFTPDDEGVPLKARRVVNKPSAKFFFYLFSLSMGCCYPPPSVDSRVAKIGSWNNICTLYIVETFTHYFIDEA